jgi:cytochrome oxidase assembly protein ShyY1
MKRFRPGIAPTLVVLVLLPLFISLGLWQLGRAEEKRVMLATYAEHRAAPPMSAELLSSESDVAYRRVQLQGEFDAEHSFLLDNSTREGRVGVELIQPFHDQVSGLWLMVNRGWLPWPDRRTPPVFDTPTHSLDLQAWVYVSPGATFQLQPDAQASAWPKLVTALNPATVWPALGREGFAHELRLESGPAAYTLGWPIVAMGPEKHIGYAVQWFAMTAALFGLYVYLGFSERQRIKKNNKKESPDGNGHEPNQHV